MFVVHDIYVGGVCFFKSNLYQIQSDRVKSVIPHRCRQAVVMCFQICYIVALRDPSFRLAKINDQHIIAV